MTLSAADIDFLRGDQAAALLADYADADLSPASTLPLLTKLRRTLDAHQAGAILTTLRLRRRALIKFPGHAADMLFTEAGLQQASGPLSRAYRAAKITSGAVLDCCCGLGADSLAFADAGHAVLGLDFDAVSIAIARHNAAVMGLNATFELADVRQPLPSGYDCIFFDPARRDGQGRRIRDVERYQPPLSLVRRWRADEIAVKLSPAVDMRQLAGYGGRLEFISANGQLSEALLWLHRPAGPPIATKLTPNAAIHFRQDIAAVAPVSAPRTWLFEPDPAIMRAGQVQSLASALNATLLDETIAYLTMDERQDTPWGRYWRIHDWMPFNLKRLRRYLRERAVGKVTVKKRGFAMLPEELIARLRLKGEGEACTLFLTRCRSQPVVVICDELAIG